MISAYYKSPDKHFTLLHGDTFDLLQKFDHKFDLIFADPPYFLSNDGLTVKDGKIVSVNKGDWDKLENFEATYEFNKTWISLVRDKMKDEATLWISGTMHNIFDVGQALRDLEFKILNIITWEKTNPPSFSCRYFTHSTEQIIWARKHSKVPHYYNYDLMRELSDNKQMKDVWTLPAISKWEKNCGKHPTQKPLAVLARLILASSKQGAWVLDPFTGSSTTGIAANLLNRKFLGIDKEKEYLDLSVARRVELENNNFRRATLEKLHGFTTTSQLRDLLARGQ